MIETAVDEFNELYAEPLGITIKTRHWSKSSYAQSGGKPQALLNEQFVNKCDAAVAIFWTRFGSPTDEYDSGTEEEIEIMLRSGKQVFMYFSDKPIPPSQMNEEGYEKVQAFRDKYKDRGIYFTYSSDEEFKKLFFAHLSMYFLSEKKIEETIGANRSELKLLGIAESGQLSGEASVCPFVLNSETTMQEYIDSIKAKYQEIAGMNVGNRTPVANTLFAGLTIPVDIDEKEREFLTSVAEQLECELPDCFFELGNLRKDSFTSNPFSGPGLKGSPEEERDRRKYYSARPYGLPGYVPDYSDDFVKELNDVFCYAIYLSENKYIVKLKVDYIKHNRTVSFPTVLLVKKKIDEIRYKITSKNNPDIIEGTLNVQN